MSTLSMPVSPTRESPEVYYDEVPEDESVVREREARRMKEMEVDDPFADAVPAATNEDDNPYTKKLAAIQKSPAKKVSAKDAFKLSLNAQTIPSKSPHTPTRHSAATAAHSPSHKSASSNLSSPSHSASASSAGSTPSPKRSSKHSIDFADSASKSSPPPTTTRSLKNIFSTEDDDEEEESAPVKQVKAPTQGSSGLEDLLAGMGDDDEDVVIDGHEEEEEEEQQEEGEEGEEEEGEEGEEEGDDTNAAAGDEDEEMAYLRSVKAPNLKKKFISEQDELAAVFGHNREEEQGEEEEEEGDEGDEEEQDEAAQGEEGAADEDQQDDDNDERAARKRRKAEKRARKEARRLKREAKAAKKEAKRKAAEAAAAAAAASGSTDESTPADAPMETEEATSSQADHIDLIGDSESSDDASSNEDEASGDEETGNAQTLDDAAIDDSDADSDWSDGNGASRKGKSRVPREAPPLPKSMQALLERIRAKTNKVEILAKPSEEEIEAERMEAKRARRAMLSDPTLAKPVTLNEESFGKEVVLELGAAEAQMDDDSDFCSDSDEEEEEDAQKEEEKQAEEKVAEGAKADATASDMSKPALTTSLTVDESQGLDIDGDTNMTDGNFLIMRSESTLNPDQLAAANQSKAEASQLQLMMNTQDMDVMDESNLVPPNSLFPALTPSPEAVKVSESTEEKVDPAIAEAEAKAAAEEAEAAASAAEAEAAAAAAAAVESSDDEDDFELDAVMPEWMRAKFEQAKKAKEDEKKAKEDEQKAQEVVADTEEKVEESSSEPEKKTAEESKEEQKQMEVDAEPVIVPATISQDMEGSAAAVDETAAAEPVATCAATLEIDVEVEEPAAGEVAAAAVAAVTVSETVVTTTSSLSIVITAAVVETDSSMSSISAAETARETAATPLLDATATPVTPVAVSAATSTDAPTASEAVKKDKKKKKKAPSSTPTDPSAATQFIDDAAESGSEEDEDDDSTPDGAEKKSKKKKNADGSESLDGGSSDEEKESPEEEAAQLAELKANFLASDEQESPDKRAHTLALHRQLDDEKEEAEIAALKKKFAIAEEKKGPSLFEKIASGALNRQTSQLDAAAPTTKANSWSARMFNAADEAAAVAAAAARRARARMADESDDEGAEGLEEDEAAMARRREERSQLQALRHASKLKPLRHITPLVTPTANPNATLSTSDSNSSITPTSAEARSDTPNQPQPQREVSEPLLENSSSLLMAPTIYRQDSSLLAPPTLGASLLDDSARAMLTSIRKTNVSTSASRIQLLAARVNGSNSSTGLGPTKSGSGDATNFAGLFPGKENVPHRGNSSAGASSSGNAAILGMNFEKFNEDLRRKEQVKLIRAGSFLQRTSSSMSLAQSASPTAANGSTATSSGLLSALENGATDFSALLSSVGSGPVTLGDKSKSNAGSTSMGGMAAAKLAASKSKSSRAFVFRAANEASRDGFENEKSQLGASNASLSAANNSVSESTTTSTGPISFSSFLSNTKRSFSTAPAPVAGLKRTHSISAQNNTNNDESGSAANSSLLHKLSKKQKL